MPEHDPSETVALLITAGAFYLMCAVVVIQAIAAVIAGPGLKGGDVLLTAFAGGCGLFAHVAAIRGQWPSWEQ